MGRDRSRCVCTHGVYESKLSLNIFGLIVLTLDTNVSLKEKKEQLTLGHRQQCGNCGGESGRRWMRVYGGIDSNGKKVKIKKIKLKL